MHVRIVDARHDELPEEIDAARGLQLLEIHRLSNRHDPIPSNRHRLGEWPASEETTVHENEVDRPQRLLRTASDCEKRNGEKSFHFESTSVYPEERSDEGSPVLEPRGPPRLLHVAQTWLMHWRSFASLPRNILSSGGS